MNTMLFGPLTWFVVGSLVLAARQGFYLRAKWPMLFPAMDESGADHPTPYQVMSSKGHTDPTAVTRGVGDYRYIAWLLMAILLAVVVLHSTGMFSWTVCWSVASFAAIVGLAWKEVASEVKKVFKDHLPYAIVASVGLVACIFNPLALGPVFFFVVAKAASSAGLLPKKKKDDDKKDDKKK